MIFHDRRDAGRRLARELAAHYAERSALIVLALPRGGLPVAHEVAAALRVPLDVFLVRKLGLPGHEELAMGAIASGGVKVLNAELVEAPGITPDVIEAGPKRYAALTPNRALRAIRRRADLPAGAAEAAPAADTGSPGPGCENHFLLDSS